MNPKEKNQQIIEEKFDIQLINENEEIKGKRCHATSILKYSLLAILFLGIIITLYILIKKGYLLKFLTFISKLGIFSPIILSICLILSSLPIIFVFAIFEVSSGFPYFSLKNFTKTQQIFHLGFLFGGILG